MDRNDDRDQPHRKRRIPSNVRGEVRGEPHRYLPETLIYPRTKDGEPIRGITREESNSGFSATFDSPFPYDTGDIVDVRVGFRRAWAEVMWTMDVLDTKTIVGFRLHPDRNNTDDTEG